MLDVLRACSEIKKTTTIPTLLRQHLCEFRFRHSDDKLLSAADEKQGMTENTNIILKYLPSLSR